jgi:dolichol kinase
MAGPIRKRPWELSEYEKLVEQREHRTGGEAGLVFFVVLLAVLLIWCFSNNMFIGQ